MAKSRQLANISSLGTSTATVSNLSNTSSLGAISNVISVPTGNTAQRPSANAGFIRYNTDLNTLESANGSAWSNVGSGSASSGGGVSWQPVQNNSFIAVRNNGYMVNTAVSNVVVTLPVSPSYGDIINITDYAGFFTSNNLTIYPNGNKVQGNTSNVVIGTSGASVGLVYTDNNRGWVGYSGFPSAIIGPYAFDYLIVAGGGGGAVGGAGAGGFITGSAVTILPGTRLTVTVGSGGASGLYPSTAGGQGGVSSLTGFTTALGGGYGGFQNDSVANGSGGGGGSGGGASRSSTVFPTGGPGTSGQGNPGGSCSTSAPYPSGGGGGAGASGTNGTGSQHGPGGSGLSSSISGTATYYAGGGGGGGGSNTGGSGGPGGGGSGSEGGAGANGGANLGGGGGGSAENTPGGAGGSGIVIIRYLGLQRATGGTITQAGGYTIHTFISSGTFTA
jgi:hypothetical protein